MDWNAVSRIEFVVFGLMICFCGCVQNRTQAVDTFYTNRLNQRLAQYTADEQTAKQQVQLVVSSFSKSSPLATQTAGAVAPKYTVEDALMAIFEAGRADAHRTVLTRFMNEAAASNQVGAMSSWVSNQATLVISLNEDANSGWVSLQQQAKSNPNDPNLMTGLVRFVSKRGIVKGAAEELQMIQNDIKGYAVDYASAAQQQVQEEARLQAALSSLSTFAYQQQELANERAAIAAINRPVTCSSFGNSVSCF